MEDFVGFDILCKLRQKGYKCNNARFEGHIYDVLKWLREEKNILLAPNPACFKEDYCIGWECEVWAYGNYNHCCVDYKTYEKASIAGIEYVLDNLI